MQQSSYFCHTGCFLNGVIKFDPCLSHSFVWLCMLVGTGSGVPSGKNPPGQQEELLGGTHLCTGKSVCWCFCVVCCVFFLGLQSQHLPSCRCVNTTGSVYDCWRPQTVCLERRIGGNSSLWKSLILVQSNTWVGFTHLASRKWFMKNFTHSLNKQCIY